MVKYIPGVDNAEADHASMKFQDEIEWELSENN